MTDTTAAITPSAKSMTSLLPAEVIWVIDPFVFVSAI
jgi:hypothetical protein